MRKTSGAYAYSCDGDVVAQEDWSIETMIDGSQVIISTRDASQFSAHFTIEARIAVSGDADYLLVFRRASHGPIVKQAHYRVEGGLIWQRDEDGNLIRVKAPADALFFPLMRVFTGAIIKTMQDRSGSTNWVVPNIATPAQLDTLFDPDVSVRRLTRDCDDGQVFYLSGGPYTTPARIKLRPDGLLENYQFTPVGSAATWVCAFVGDVKG